MNTRVDAQGETVKSRFTTRERRPQLTSSVSRSAIFVDISPTRRSQVPRSEVASESDMSPPYSFIRAVKLRSCSTRAALIQDQGSAELNAILEGGSSVHERILFIFSMRCTRSPSRCVYASIDCLIQQHAARSGPSKGKTLVQYLYVLFHDVRLILELGCAFLLATMPAWIRTRLCQECVQERALYEHLCSEAHLVHLLGARGRWFPMQASAVRQSSPGVV